MRYIWLIFLALFIVIGTIFAYQNQDPVALRFHLTWINLSLGFAARPVFIPIFIALATGMFLAGLYLFGYHTRLRIQVQMQESEIYRLKKMVLLERDKQKQLAQKRPSSTEESQPAPPEPLESNL